MDIRDSNKTMYYIQLFTTVLITMDQNGNTQMSTNGSLDKQNVLSPHSGVSSATLTCGICSRWTTLENLMLSEEASTKGEVSHNSAVCGARNSQRQRWKVGLGLGSSMAKSASCSCRGPTFGSQHP